ncbi:MAG: 23S rRNA (guanosine(2251)-2'-O)-methyltransferase RlmB [Acidimicrobiia bacterium]|nr:23S rRNA (guanosine(2251)-2'-O)-methyltransferase RlmB [Acidimicrobiia bacterium]
MSRRSPKKSSGRGPSARHGAGRGGRRSAGGGSGRQQRSSSGGGPSRGDGRDGSSGGRANRRRVKGLGGDQVEGRQAVRELLLAGKRPVREVLMIEDLAPADILVDIEELANELGVGFRKVSRRHLESEAVTDSHQGVIARATALSEADFDRLIADPKAFLVVLDGVTDPHNLGAILRTAECAGVTGVVLGRHRSAHVSPTVTKTAAGAVEHVPISVVGGIPASLAAMKEAGVLTVGLDEAGEHSIFDLSLSDHGQIALVLGAEGRGLSQLVRKRVDVLASIPLAGSLNSLNVAMAAAVSCFEVLRTRQGR